MAENGANSGSYFSVEGKTCDALREWLRSHGLSTSGKKADLISRLVLHTILRDLLLMHEQLTVLVKYLSPALCVP